MATYMGLRGRALSTAIAFTAGLVFVAFGYGQGDIGGLITVESFRERYPEIDVIGNPGNIHIARIQGITVATWNIGCFVSAIITIFMGDILGRKKTLMLGIVLMTIGKIVQCSSYSFGQYIVGRFIAGFGNGFNTSTMPAYQAECTKAYRRGTMLMVSSGSCISLGLAIAYWIDFATAWAEPNSVSWRFPIALQLLWGLPALIMLIFLPESPRWLILMGREQEALNVISALNDETPEDEDVRQEFLQIKDAIIQMASSSFSTLFSMGEYRYMHRTILAVVLQLFQQFCGINLITQYLAQMFAQQMGYTGWVARLLAGCSASELVLASFVAVIGIDRFWGRRSLAMFGAAGMCLSMIILTIMGYIDTSASHIVMAVFIFVFNTFFAIGWQGMSWLWAVELTPLAIRGPANALATSANWLANFIVVLIAPIAFESIGYKTYIIFAVLNAAILPAIYFFYPETGCRSLEEVDVLFAHASTGSKSSIPSGTSSSSSSTAAASQHTKGANPWLSVVRIAAAEPLWYGKDGETPFSYEQSEWHARFARLSADDDNNTDMDNSQSSSLGASAEKQTTPLGTDETGTTAVGSSRDGSENEKTMRFGSGSGGSQDSETGSGRLLSAAQIAMMPGGGKE